MKKALFILPILLLLAAIVYEPAYSQCAMCKGAAETSVQEGSQDASGLNFGVLYLFMTPYLLVLTIGGLWYWNYRRNKKFAERRSYMMDEVNDIT